MIQKILVLAPGSTLVISSPVYAEAHAQGGLNAEKNAAEQSGESDKECAAQPLDEYSDEALLSLNGLIAAEIEKRGLMNSQQSPTEPPRPARRRRKRQELPDL